MTSILASWIRASYQADLPAFERVHAFIIDHPCPPPLSQVIDVLREASRFATTLGAKVGVLIAINPRSLIELRATAQYQYDRWGGHPGSLGFPYLFLCENQVDIYPEANLVEQRPVKILANNAEEVIADYRLYLSYDHYEDQFVAEPIALLFQ